MSEKRYIDASVSSVLVRKLVGWLGVSLFFATRLSGVSQWLWPPVGGAKPLGSERQAVAQLSGVGQAATGREGSASRAGSDGSVHDESGRRRVCKPLQLGSPTACVR